MLYDSNYYTARYWNAWNEDDLAKSETAYQDLKQAIQWTDGFAVFIVHGAIQEHLKVFSRIERELRQFKFHQLEFSPKDSASLEQQLDNLPNSSELNAIFISTPDFRITTYSKHLKFRRELLYQKYQFCLIFFANREWSNDCLELCSWGWEIPTQGLPEFLGDYCDYCHWLELTKLDRIYEIQTFIADNNPPLPLRLSLLWEQGKILYSYGNHTAALAIYQELLTHQSQAIEVMRHMGYSLHQLGEFEQAITTFDRVLQQIPEDAKAWWNRGWALSKLQRWEAAIVAYEKALEYQPNHWWSQQMLCRALYQAQRYEAALTLCDEVLKHQPDESAVWNDRGIILFNLGRYLESITAYGHALKLNPSARVWKNRGYACRRINWNKQEIHSYRQALRLEPNDYPTVQLLSRRLWSLKRHTEAVQILQEFLQISPVHNMAWAKLADWLTILKQDEEAIAAYQMAIQYGQTGDRLTHQGNLLYHLNRLISLQPDNADHFYQRACLYSQLGDQARTIADLSQAIQINPAKYRQRSTWENVNVTALMLKHRGKIRVR